MKVIWKLVIDRGLQINVKMCYNNAGYNHNHKEVMLCLNRL